MKALIIFLIIFIVSVFHTSAKDTLKYFKLEEVEISAKKNLSPFEAVYYGTDFNSRIYDKNGNFTIRRGMNFTQDIYFEGFSRNNIKVVIDGEQYHSACPNRMDSPAGRINPLEMEAVEITKSGSLRGTGIYGKIEYHRKDYPEEYKLGTFLTGNLISQKEYDLGVSLSAYKHGFITRISGGSPYLSGNNSDFKQLYGYKDNFNYFNVKSTFRGKSGDMNYGVTFNRLENISFPYLTMDETASNHISADVSYQGNKFYVSYTKHLMDNTMRISPMFMESDARNLTLGLVGSFYEVTYRNWNADNKIINAGMNVNLSNNMLPDIGQLYAAVNHSIDFDDVILTGRVGLSTLDAGNKQALELHRTLYDGSDERKYYLSGALNLHYSGIVFDELGFGAGAEFAIEAPEAEQLFIGVKRPGMNPDWIGNTTLEQPKKSSVRLDLSSEYFSINVYANYVADYINLTKANAGGKNVLTYRNTNALITGVNLNLKYNFIQSSISYVYGENTSNRNPLPEIMPLSVTNMIELPTVLNIVPVIIHRFENYQPRIDTELNEFSSDSWNTLALRLSYNYKGAVFMLEANNLLNHNYYRHLSFARNPFSAGSRVYEPGTVLRFTLVYDGLL
ncbi:MAG: hypothetical protein WC313_00895 [Candidatus Kapaibacterium sp.]